MRLALQQAQMAFNAGEVPIGAVLVVDAHVEAAAYNMTEARHNPLCHAELLCISAAANKQLAWRLQDATLYSTIEPCPMCAGAILQARLTRLVYGAKQPRVGADGSWVAMFPRQQQQEQKEESDTDQCLSQLEQGQEQQHQQAALQPTGPHPFHPDIEVTSGVLAEECAELMRAFFRKRRKEVKANKAAATAAAAGVMAAAPADVTLTVPCSCGGPIQPQALQGLTTADQSTDNTTVSPKGTHSRVEGGTPMNGTELGSPSSASSNAGRSSSSSSSSGSAAAFDAGVLWLSSSSVESDTEADTETVCA